MITQRIKNKYAWKHEGSSQSILNKCPAENKCCFCLSPKFGTITTAILGLLLSTCYLMFFLVGESILPKFGLSDDATQIVIHTYAVVGILLFSANITLLIATFKYIETLILLYQWTLIIYCIVDILIVLYVSVIAIYGKHVIIGIILFTIDVIYWIVIYVFIFPAVNGFRRSIHTILIVLT